MNPRAVAGIFMAGALAAGAALAQNGSTAVAAQADWLIFVNENPKQCWVLSSPKKTLNTKDGREVAVNRGEIYMFVSFWTDKNQQGEVSFMGGYPFADGSTVTLTVGESKFELFTDGEMAWAASPDDDRRIATAMKRGSEAMVEGRSSRGTQTKDTFSLIGFTAAYDDAMKRCTG